jgi:hypothetical protein
MIHLTGELFVIEWQALGRVLGHPLATGFGGGATMSEEAGSGLLGSDHLIVVRPADHLAHISHTKHVLGQQYFVYVLLP